MYEFMLAFSVVLFGAVTLFYARHPAASVFHPLTYYLMFHGVVFVVRPIFSWYYGFTKLYSVVGFNPTPWEKTQALIATNLGLVAFTAGCLTLANQRLRFQPVGAATDNRDALLRAFWPFAIPIAAAGLWATLWIWSLAGNWDQYRSISSASGSAALVGVNGYFISMPAMLAPLVAIIAYLGRFRLWSFVPFAVYALLKLGTGGRGQVVAAAVMVALLYMYERKVRWPGFAVVAAAVLGWSIFSTIGADRGASIRAIFGYETEAAQHSFIAEKPMETMDLANLEFLEYYIWAVPKRTGNYEYFVHNLQIFTEPIPRALWPGKPVGPPILMFDLYRYAQPLGMTASVTGNGWVALGFAGVAIWSVFFGVLYGAAYSLFARKQVSVIGLVAYAVFVSTSIVAYRDGAILTILKQLQFFFVPVIALYFAKLYLDSTGARTGQALAGSPGTTSGLTARERRRAAAAGGAQSPAAPVLAPQDGIAAQVTTASPRARRMARRQGLA